MHKPLHNPNRLLTSHQTQLIHKHNSYHSQPPSLTQSSNEPPTQKSSRTNQTTQTFHHHLSHAHSTSQPHRPNPLYTPPCRTRPPDKLVTTLQSTMSREQYQVPNLGGGAQNAFGDAGGPMDGPVVAYLCGECNSRVSLKRGDQIRCKECGHRVLYKERTKRLVFSSLFFPWGVCYGEKEGNSGGEV